MYFKETKNNYTIQHIYITYILNLVNRKIYLFYLNYKKLLVLAVFFVGHVVKEIGTVFKDIDEHIYIPNLMQYLI